MKNLDSQSYNVEELSARELVEVIGGNWWSDFKEGFKEGLQLCKEAIMTLREIF